MDDDEFEKSSNGFVEWLNKSGAAISSKVELADFRDRAAGRGVIAVEDIAEDEELFSIPRTAILDVSMSSLPDEVRKRLDDPWLCLILAMIREHSLGEESAYRAYLNVLPEHFDTLMYWSNQELSNLKGSAVVDKIGKKSADAVFVDQIIPVIREHPEVFSASMLSDDDLMALSHRMGSLIMAYAFDLEDVSPPTESREEWEDDKNSEADMSKGMIPLADMLNADADRNNARLFYNDDTKVVMRAIKPVKKGEELFNDYGPLPQADVLRRYGYVTENYAKYDVVEISTELIRTVAREVLQMDQEAFDMRVDYLSEQGLEEISFDVARAASQDGQFPDELCIFLNTIAMPTLEFQRLKQKDKIPRPELSENKIIQLLDTVLVRRTELYPLECAGIGAQDIMNNDTNHKTERRRTMALAVIEGEKVVLREARETVQALIGNLENGKRKLLVSRNGDRQLQEPSKRRKA